MKEPHPYLIDSPTPVWRRIFHHLKMIEIAMSITALGVAMWQLLLIDPGYIGFAAVWMAPLLLVVLSMLRGRLSKGAAAAATFYLLLVAMGTWIGPQHAIFPGLGGKGTTDDALGRLDFTSRRLIFWNMALAGIVIWTVIPHWLFVRELQRKRRGLPTQLSSFTCWFGLAFFWGTLVVALPAFIMLLF